MEVSFIEMRSSVPETFMLNVTRVKACLQNRSVALMSAHKLSKERVKIVGQLGSCAFRGTQAHIQDL